MSRTKIALLVSCIALGLLLTMLIPKDEKKLENAIVNSSNGDIAVTFFSHNPVSALSFYLYDNNGNLLFKKVFGGAAKSPKMAFDGEILNISFNTPSGGKQYAYNRNGDLVNNTVSRDKLRDEKEWISWESKRGGKFYNFNGEQYCYEQTPYPQSLFSQECKLYIKKANGDVIKLLHFYN